MRSTRIGNLSMWIREYERVCVGLLFDAVPAFNFIFTFQLWHISFPKFKLVKIVREKRFFFFLINEIFRISKFNEIRLSRRN